MSRSGASSTVSSAPKSASARSSSPVTKTSTEPFATALLLTTFGALLAASILFSRGAEKGGIPVALIFLILGMAAGSVILSLHSKSSRTTMELDQQFVLSGQDDFGAPLPNDGCTLRLRFGATIVKGSATVNWHQAWVVCPDCP